MTVALSISSVTSDGRRLGVTCRVGVKPESGKAAVSSTVTGSTRQGPEGTLSSTSDSTCDEPDGSELLKLFFSLLGFTSDEDRCRRFRWICSSSLGEFVGMSITSALHLWSEGAVVGFDSRGDSEGFGIECLMRTSGTRLAVLSVFLPSGSSVSDHKGILLTLWQKIMVGEGAGQVVTKCTSQ